MKRLDLSYLPLNLEVGETIELIDKNGEYHLLKCVSSKKCSCGECFFSKSSAPFKCDKVMCLSEERGEEREDVIYVELP